MYDIRYYNDKLHVSPQCFSNNTRKPGCAFGRRVTKTPDCQSLVCGYRVVVIKQISA